MAWEGLGRLCGLRTLSAEQASQIDVLIGEQCSERSIFALEQLMQAGYRKVSRGTRRAVVGFLLAHQSNPDLLARLAALIDEEAGFVRQESLWRYLMRKRSDTNRLFVAEAVGMALSALGPVASLDWVLQCLREGRLMRPNKLELIKKAIPTTMLPDEQLIILGHLLNQSIGTEEWGRLGPQLLMHPQAWLHWRRLSQPPATVDELVGLPASIPLAPLIGERPLIGARLFEVLFVRLKGEALNKTADDEEVVGGLDRLFEVIGLLRECPEAVHLLDGELVRHALEWTKNWAKAGDSIPRWRLLRAMVDFTGGDFGEEKPDSWLAQAIMGKSPSDLDLKKVLAQADLPIEAAHTILALEFTDEEACKLACQLSLRVAHEQGKVVANHAHFDGCSEGDQVFLVSKIEFYTADRPSLALIQLSVEWLQGKGKLNSERLLDKLQALISLYLTSTDISLRSSCHALISLIARRAGSDFAHALHDDLLRRTIQHQEHAAAPLYLEACVALSLRLPAELINLHVLLGILFSLGRSSAPASLRQAAFEGLRLLLPLILDSQEHEMLASMVVKEHLLMPLHPCHDILEAFYRLAVALCLSPNADGGLQLVCLDLLASGQPHLGIEAAHHLIIFGRMPLDSALLQAIEEMLASSPSTMQTENLSSCLSCLELIAERHVEIWNEQLQRFFPLLVQLYARQPALFVERKSWWEGKVWRETIEAGLPLWSLLWQSQTAALPYAHLCMRQFSLYPRAPDLHQQLVRLALRLTMKPEDEAGYLEDQQAALEIITFLLGVSLEPESLPILQSCLTPLLNLPHIGSQLRVRLSQAMREAEEWRQPRLAKLLLESSAKSASPFDYCHGWLTHLNLAVAGFGGPLQTEEAFKLSAFLLEKIVEPREIVSFTDYAPGASFTARTLGLWPAVCKSHLLNKEAKAMVFRRSICFCLLLPPTAASIGGLTELMLLDELVGEAREALPDVGNRLRDFCLDRGVLGSTLNLLQMLIRRFDYPDHQDALQLCKHLLSSCMARGEAFGELLEVLQALDAQPFLQRALYEFIRLAESSEEHLRQLAMALPRLPLQLPLILAGDSLARLRLASVTLSVHEATDEGLLAEYAALFKQHLTVAPTSVMEPFMLLLRGSRRHSGLAGLVIELTLAILSLPDPSPFLPALQQLSLSTDGFSPLLQRYLATLS